MKPLLHYILFTICITLFFSKAFSQSDELNKKDFLNPPNSVKVHTWWHWLDGAISKQGITKDLESMKKQGIVQATILNVGLFNDKDLGVNPPINFNSPQWYEMFQWALQEANRLDITIGAHNCDGWSSSGGPWITPELSMKHYTWTKTIVKGGGKKIITKLEKPYAKKEFYQDVAVIAFKTQLKLNSFRTSKPKVTTTGEGIPALLFDGNPITDIPLKLHDKITITFPTDFTADKIVIYPDKSFMWSELGKVQSRFTLMASLDGKVYRKIKDIEFTGLNKSFIFKIPSTKAKYFQIIRQEISNMEPWVEYSVGEIELLKNNETPTYSPSMQGHMEKTVFVKPQNKKDFEFVDSTKTNQSFIDPTTIIDITDKMSVDGTLSWTAPEGNWSILRFGYTTTGAINAPATASGIGLECDKMDASAVNFHFKSYPQKLINSAGKYAGNTFKFLLVDSWECNYQNWTKNFPSEFEKLRGYKITNWIPVLCGETVSNVEQSDAFLYDFRKTIADLIEINYYKRFSELCHEQNIEFHSEVIYGDANYPPVDILKSNSYLDLPMYEFWAPNNKDGLTDFKPSARPEANFPVYSSLLYDKPIIGAESYTAQAHYSESLRELKPFGDKAYCSGINQFILHSYVHQPTDRKPGITLQQWGSHFNRNNPYWNFTSDWLNYHARIQYVLQQGQPVYDVLYYIGDQLPQYLDNKFVSALPPNYRPVPCNYDILKNKTTVQNGKIILTANETQSQSLLILADNNAMELNTLKRLEELVADGAVIYGSKPNRTLSLAGTQKDKKAFEELTQKLWARSDNKSVTENNYGKGKVIWGKPIAQALSALEESPEFMSNFSDSLNLMYIHKRAGNKEIFFVCSQQNFPMNREFLFRTNGKTPEIWNPEYGTVSRPAIYSIEKDQVRIPVSLKPYESLIFIFSDDKNETYIQKVSKDGKFIFPLQQSADTIYSMPQAILNQKYISLTTNATGDYLLTTNKNKSIKSMLTQGQTLEVRDFRGTVDFSPIYKADIKPIEISNLKPLDEFENPDVKYFAGNAHYTIKFTVPANYALKTDSIFLSLGKLDASAEVKLNNKFLGNIWLPDFMIPVNNLINGENQLDVVVATPVRNRILGDFKENNNALKNIWTPAPLEYFLSKEKPLKPVGLMGPIKLVRYSVINMKE